MNSAPANRSTNVAVDPMSEIKATRILGVPVSVINMQDAINVIGYWTKEATSNYICVRDVHGIMQAQADGLLREIHENAGLITPDGMPLVWIGQMRGEKHIGRVSGADLVEALCAASVRLGLRHFFYGGKPGVADKMAAMLARR